MTDKTPAQIEAEDDETTTVSWDGIDIVIPATAEVLDLDALEALENGKGVTFMRHLIGSKRYDEVRKEWARDHGRRPTPRDFAPFMEQAAKALGFEAQGNS